ncbi:hypothetical protein [Desulfonatronospira sp.]|uniref:hypothetical protein n=1 Tax=Desulfonatronospira sp. TaxID=1962951 RepID=UPI0025C0D6E8|nr:hypothetical protein [Desulfonatronospira sp.]
MKFILWALLLLVFSTWFLGYKYIQMHAEIRSREHKILLREARTKEKITGLEQEKENLEKEIQETDSELNRLKYQG